MSINETRSISVDFLFEINELDDVVLKAHLLNTLAELNCEIGKIDHINQFSIIVDLIKFFFTKSPDAFDYDDVEKSISIIIKIVGNLVKSPTTAKS